MNPDEQVYLGGETIKRLGDCSADEVEMVAENFARHAARLEAGMEAIRSGRTPLCDYRDFDGEFCESESEWVWPGDDPPAGLRLLCAAHRASLGL
jgi:hypothetical protein